jgi:hypothetical protein
MGAIAGTVCSLIMIFPPYLEGFCLMWTLKTCEINIMLVRTLSFDSSIA